MLKQWLMEYEDEDGNNLGLTDKDFGTWATDLYVKVKPGLIEALMKFQAEKNPHMKWYKFKSHIDNSKWIDVAFQNWDHDACNLMPKQKNMQNLTTWDKHDEK